MVEFPENRVALADNIDFGAVAVREYIHIKKRILTKGKTISFYTIKREIHLLYYLNFKSNYYSAILPDIAKTWRNEGLGYQ